MLTPTTFGALPALRIDAADGARAIVTLYGAQVVSWRAADGCERLFCSARSALDGSRPIRGGVPVIFPQFAARGDGLRHGFARVSVWRADGGGADGDGGSHAEFALGPDDLTPALARAWPFAFALRLRVALKGDALELALTVRNAGAAPFPFAAALHSYHLVERLDQAGVDGLQGLGYTDERQAGRQDEATLRIADKLDRIYWQVPPALTLRAGAATRTLEQAGFCDAVVWNPGAADAAALDDLDDADYRRFLCVEPALIAPATLAPGAEWRGWQRMRAAGVGE